MKPYYTILVPWAPREVATIWHPTESTGPFKVLNRGNYDSPLAAIQWAQDKLNGCPYEIKRIDPEADSRHPALAAMASVIDAQQVLNVAEYGREVNVLTSDFANHDASCLASKETSERFGWMVRSTGTYLMWPGTTVSAASLLDDGSCFYWDGKELRNVTAERLDELLAV